MVWSNLGRLLALGLAVGVLAGCSAYRPLPLDQAAVDAALAPPTLEAIKVDAVQLQHPLLPSLVIDGRDGFAPDEIAVMTVVASPRLRAVRDQRGLARAQVVQAGILPNPQLSYALDRPHGNSDPTLVDATNLGLSWELTALLARHDMVAAAKAGARAVDLAIAWQEWQAAQDARLRAYRVLSLETQLALAREIEVDQADNLALVEQARTRGHQTSADLTAAVLAWSQAQDGRLLLDKQLHAERAALNLALGLAPGQALRLKHGAASPRLIQQDEPTAASWLEGLERRRLDLVALTLGYESQDATLRAAVKQQFPKIGLSLAQARDPSDIKTRGFGVSVDLPLFDRNQGQVAIAKASRQQLFDEYVARVAEARAEVGQILDELGLARAQLKTVRESLPELEKLVAGFEKALASRNADVAASRDARGALVARRIAECQLGQSVLELEVALEIATGRTLRNHDAAP